ncbi:ribosomal RNA-processing protein 8 [Anopheles bellator]|uniref:ribosomal RNA-processing protein 8 n=1 Tax=Anopheles bellator TaxID=139047 RepID=UPI002648362A|nr:ribosomal RNA-processing protein 8 [Anopheles bellator]
MSKVFSDCDFETDLPSIGTDFRFRPNKGLIKKVKEKKVPKVARSEENATETENGHRKPAGWSVRLPKPGNVDNQATVANGTNAKNRKAKKRKATDERTNNENTKEVNAPQENEPLKKKTKHQKLVNGKTNTTEHADKRTNGDLSDKTKPKKPVGTATDLREKLLDQLKGSRFRFINEQLYKTTGEQAKKLFEEDPGSFEAYHDGYRHQIAQWSMNPLDRIIRNIRKLPKNTVVADFGCGEARLAASIPNQVYSLDLVANSSNVIACDMAKTPLESNFVNVVVFCLSLMGTNLVDFLLEANRVLKVGGILKIAEVSSRFDGVNEFIGKVKQCGFALENKDLKHKLFYFFTFKKERTVQRDLTKIKQFSLKPCLYKKR